MLVSAKHQHALFIPWHVLSSWGVSTYRLVSFWQSSFPTVLVSYFYYNKSPQTYQFKTTRIYYIIILGVRSPDWVSMGYIGRIVLLPGNSRRKSICLPSPAFEAGILARGPCLHLHSQQPHQPSLCIHHHLSSASDPPASLSQGLLWLHQALRIISDLKSLNLITSSNSLFPNEITFIDSRDLMKVSFGNSFFTLPHHSFDIFLLFWRWAFKQFHTSVIWS